MSAPDPLAVAARGLAVFPLPPGGRRPAPGWQDWCTNDPDSIRRLWTPGDNIGVGCRASDVVGLDLDRHPGVDGIAAFAAACTAHGADWPATLTIRTPHGGLHLYFRAGGRPIGSTSGGRTRLGPGIDTRGPGRLSGGYLVGPGSAVGGVPYVVDLDVAVADIPDWLAALLTATTRA